MGISKDWHISYITVSFKIKNKMIKRMRKLSIGTVFKILGRGLHTGFCPVCEKKTVFFKKGDWLRDHYHCARCLSIPRQRVLMQSLEQFYPGWRELDVHESSPSGLTYNKFSAECENYVPTQFFPDVSSGTVYQGFRCEDLARQSFKDESFDIVITQDVLEHLLSPVESLQEICRTLRPGGAHIFTVPWYSWQDTKVRVRKNGDEIEYLDKPDYHDNPVDEKGSLVVTEWGRDLADTIYAATGMTTTVIRIDDKHIGAEAKFIEVFLSRKLPLAKNQLLDRWGIE